MNPVAVNEPSVCPECGTLRGMREAVALRWSDWRRWLWPALGVLWVVGLLVWENKDLLTGATGRSAAVTTPMPGSTVPRHLSVGVGELRAIAESGTGDRLARELMTRSGMFYSGHVEERGAVAVATTEAAGYVNRAWGIGWPWGVVVRSVAENYADVAARTKKVEGPDYYPPRTRVQMLGIVWSKFPAGGWDYFAIDVQPLLCVVIMGWIAGLAAGGVARLARAGLEKRRRARAWTRWTVIGVGLVLNAMSFRQAQASHGKATSAATTTGLTRETLEGLKGRPEADTVVAKEILRALNGVDNAERVEWCYVLPGEWKATGQSALIALPFLSMSAIEAKDPMLVPRAQAGHWGWIGWCVWGHSKDGLRAMSAQVLLDGLLWWVVPLWLGCGVVPWIVRYWRNATLRRRLRRGLCAACGYELGGGPEISAPG